MGAPDRAELRRRVQGKRSAGPHGAGGANRRPRATAAATRGTAGERCGKHPRAAPRPSGAPAGVSLRSSAARGGGDAAVRRTLRNARDKVRRLTRAAPGRASRYAQPAAVRRTLRNARDKFAGSPARRHLGPHAARLTPSASLSHRPLPESTCRSRRCGRTHFEDCATAANHFMTAGSGGGRGAFTTFGGWNQADYSRCGG